MPRPHINNVLSPYESFVLLVQCNLLEQDNHGPAHFSTSYFQQHNNSTCCGSHARVSCVPLPKIIKTVHWRQSTACRIPLQCLPSRLRHRGLCRPWMTSARPRLKMDDLLPRYLPTQAQQQQCNGTSGPFSLSNNVSEKSPSLKTCSQVISYKLLNSPFLVSR